MKKNSMLWIFSVVLALAFVSFAFAEGDVPKDDKKKTTLGKYITAAKAYEQWKASPDKIFIVDIRTPQEYVFLGHPEMALNLPFGIWTDEVDMIAKDAYLVQNPDFVKEMQKRYKTEDTIFLICRSGNRSAPATNELAKVGFKNVFNVTDGFEGDKLKDPASPNNGKRTVNGWKNSPAPWTYNLDLKLMPTMTAK